MLITDATQKKNCSKASDRENILFNTCSTLNTPGFQSVCRNQQICRHAFGYDLNILEHDDFKLFLGNCCTLQILGFMFQLHDRQETGGGGQGNAIVY